MNKQVQAKHREGSFLEQVFQGKSDQLCQVLLIDELR